MNNQIDNILREKTKAAIEMSKEKWKLRQEPQDSGQGQEITFLGTGGNPEAVIGQVPQTAGFYIHLDGLKLYVDPGIGAPGACRDMGIDAGALDAIFISHGHTDHYAGAETMIEAMCWGMFVKRGKVLAPKQVFEEKNIISSYHQGKKNYGGYQGSPELVYLEPHQTVDLKGVRLTPIPAYHADENYGFILEGKNYKIGYTSDTNYIRSFATPEGVVEVSRMGTVMDMKEIVDYRTDIKEAYSDVDVLIANVTCHNAWLHRHITTMGLAHLLRGSKVKLCIMTHFNYCCVEPEDIRDIMAKFVAQETSIKVLPAHDGQLFNLSKLL